MNAHELDLLELGLRTTVFLSLEEKIRPGQGWVVDDHPVRSVARQSVPDLHDRPGSDHGSRLVL